MSEIRKLMSLGKMMILGIVLIGAWNMYHVLDVEPTEEQTYTGSLSMNVKTKDGIIPDFYAQQNPFPQGESISGTSKSTNFYWLSFIIAVIGFVIIVLLFALIRLNIIGIIKNEKR